MKYLLPTLAVLGICGSANAILFDAILPSNNATTQAAFYTAAGIVSPEHFVDFESVALGTNVHNNSSLFANLTISASNSSAIISGGAGSIGGSNPIDARAVELAEGSTINLTFADPVDYIGGYDIDQGGLTLTVFLVGGSSETLSLEGTGASGNSAEFWGYVKNVGGPQISSIRFSSVSGASGWALDNLQYNTAVPEPCTILALGTGALALMRRRLAK